MTYLDYINRFWKLHETQYFTLSESFLYFFLLHIANKNHWAEPFYYSNEDILDRSELSLSTLKRAKRSLKARGLIDYVPSTGRGHASAYRILSDIKGFSQTPFMEEKGSQTPFIVTPFSKEKEKGNKKKIETSPMYEDKDISLERKKESVLNSSIVIETDPPLSAPIPIEDILVKIRTTEQAWIERFCMNNQISLRDFNIMSDLFIKELENRNTKSKTIADYQHHFASWFAKQKERQDAKRTNYRLEQKQQITDILAGSLETELAQLDANYIRKRAGEELEEHVPDTKSSVCGLQPAGGDYPFK